MTHMESEWLKYRSKVTGKSVEELRAEMAERSSKADPSKRGFAVMTPEQKAEFYKNRSLKRKGVDSGNDS